MIVVSLLAASVLITSARASSTSRWLLPYDLYDQRSLENRDQPPRSANDVDRNYPMDVYPGVDSSDFDDVRESSLARTKKLGLGRNSLSIVNPVDVLRQRVLLELARRKAMQDQRQVDANRRMLASVGKRSIHQNRSDRSENSSRRNDDVYIDAIQTENQDRVNRSHTQRVPVNDSREWYNVDDSVIRGSSSSSSNGEDDETQKSMFNYHHDRV